MAHWLLQTNPRDERAAEILAAGHTPATWAVRRYRDLVTAGDSVAVWRSGKGGGVVAVGSITTDPVRGHDAEWTVEVTLAQVFTGAPITRDVLRTDIRFASAMVLRAPGGGNPSPLETAAWEAIEERVPPHGPVAATVRGAAAAVAAGATAVREAFRTAVRRG